MQADPLSERGTQAEVRRALLDFRARGGTIRQAAAHCGVPRQVLDDLVAGRPRRVSSPRCATILERLPTAPLGRRVDRRLFRGLDEHAPVVREPDYHAYADAAHRFALTRDYLTSEEREAAWRGVLSLWDTWAARERQGRGGASYLARARSDPSTDLAAYSDEAVSLYRREQRRKRAGLVDGYGPRTREFLTARLAMLAFRDELRGIRLQPAPTRQALECLCSQISRAARWARTVEINTAQAQVRAEHKRRAAEQWQQPLPGGDPPCWWCGAALKGRHGRTCDAPAIWTHEIIAGWPSNASKVLHSLGERRERAREAARAHEVEWGPSRDPTVTVDREPDGRWIARVQELRGAHVYGHLPRRSDGARPRAQVLTFTVIAAGVLLGTGPGSLSADGIVLRNRKVPLR